MSEGANYGDGESNKQSFGAVFRLCGIAVPCGNRSVQIVRRWFRATTIHLFYTRANPESAELEDGDNTRNKAIMIDSS